MTMPAGGISASGARAAVSACSRGRSARVPASGEGMSTATAPYCSTRMGDVVIAPAIFEKGNIIARRKPNTISQAQSQERLLEPFLAGQGIAMAHHRTQVMGHCLYGIMRNPGEDHATDFSGMFG